MRHSVHALRLVLDALTTGHREFEHVKALICHLERFYDITATAGNFLTPTEAAEARNSLQAVGAHHQFLCDKYMAMHRPLFRVKIKAHMVQHIADYCVYFNPRAGWTYSDEDYMGKLSRIATECLAGRGPMRIGKAIFDRWCKLMDLRWKRLE